VEAIFLGFKIQMISMTVPDGSAVFNQDASFNVIAPWAPLVRTNARQWLQSIDHPDRFIRQRRSMDCRNSKRAPHCPQMRAAEWVFATTTIVMM
jgi:hypothetical protein